SDAYASVAGDDLADLNGLHTSSGARLVPRLSVGRRNSHEETARRLWIQDQPAQRIVDAIERDLRTVIEVRAVSLEAAEADPGLGVSTSAREEWHEARPDVQPDRRSLRHLVGVTRKPEARDVSRRVELGVDGGLGRRAIERDHRGDRRRQVGRIEVAVLVSCGQDAGPDRLRQPEGVARTQV